MVSTLTWIDHDSRARERTLRILAQFQEKESRDELGIGTVRDSLADLLFPAPAPSRHGCVICSSFPGFTGRWKTKK